MNYAPAAPTTHPSIPTQVGFQPPGIPTTYAAATPQRPGPSSGPGSAYGPGPRPSQGYGPGPAYGPPVGPPPAQGPAFPPQRPFSPTPPSRTSRLPSTAEVLGWGGGLTTLVGVAAVTWDFWSAIRGLALVALLMAATGVLGVAAAVVGDLDRRHDDQLAANLSTGLWWMTGITATFATYVATDELAGGRAYLALLAAAVAATAMFTAAAYRTGRDSALAAAITSAAVAAFAAASTASLAGPHRALAVWGVALVGVIGLTLWTGRDSRTAYATSLAILFGAAQTVLFADSGVIPVVVVATGMLVAAILAWTTRTRGEAITTSLLATVVACQLVHELAPQAFSLSAGILLTGLGMTAGCIHLVRRSIRDQT